MTASQKAEFTQRTLMALMTAQADRAELDQQVEVMIRALATEHGCPRPTRRGIDRAPIAYPFISAPHLRMGATPSRTRDLPRYLAHFQTRIASADFRKPCRAP
jgi:hypothetical protein